MLTQQTGQTIHFCVSDLNNTKVRLDIKLAEKA